MRFDVARSARRRPTCRRSSARSARAARLKLWLPFVVAAAIAAFVFADRDFRATREMIVGGIVIGAVIVGGWYVSGHLGYLAEDPATLEEKFVATNSGRAESFSFVAPVAYLLELLMLLDRPVARAHVRHRRRARHARRIGRRMALATRTFRWEGFATIEDLANHVVGGVLMGFGGVTALGCTIGQGLTGMSTLAVGSFLALRRDHRRLRAGGALPEWRLDRMA